MMINDFSFLQFVIYSLAVWRLSNLLVNEDGPYYLLIRFRIFVGTDYKIDDEIATAEEIAMLPMSVVINHKTEISKMLSCVWCTSIWVSLFFVFCLITLDKELLVIFDTILIWLSISALAIKIDGV